MYVCERNRRRESERKSNQLCLWITRPVINQTEERDNSYLPVNHAKATHCTQIHYNLNISPSVYLTWSETSVRGRLDSTALAPSGSCSISSKNRPRGKSSRRAARAASATTVRCRRGETFTHNTPGAVK